MSDEREGHIERVVGPIVAAHDADVEFVTLRRAGRRTVVVIAVDADGGISLDTIAALSPQISEALDAEDVMGDAPYTLEVSSPGINRPLTAPRHWRRAAGRLVAVNLVDGSETTGRITGSDDQSATLDVAGEERSVPFSDVRKAVVQVEFNEKDA